MTPPNQYEVTVVQNVRVTEGLHILHLSKPEGFAFAPGQFVVLQDTLEKPVRRSYSIASSPQHDTIAIAVREQPKGLFSPHLCSLEIGHTLTLLGPYGLFTRSNKPGPYVFIGAGTGVAPFVSMLGELGAMQCQDNVYLLTSSRTPEDRLLVEEIRRAEETLRLRHIETITRPTNGMDWDGHTGRFSVEMLTSLDLPLSASYFICGPTAMVVAVKAMLEELGVSTQRIIVEKYGKIQM